LEHDPDMLAAEPRQLVLVQRIQPLPGDGHAPRAGGLPGATISSDDLPEPDGPRAPAPRRARR
jgi:hypothetical protein